MILRTAPPAGFRQPVADARPLVIERIVHSLRPDKIILFGSYASGTPTPDSDVDLLVVLDTDLVPVERYRAVSRLITPRSFPVDIIVRTPAEIVSALAKGDWFIRGALEHGQVLYDRA